MGSQRVRHDWVTHLSKRTSVLTANKSWFVVVVELLCYVRLFAAQWSAACQASLSFTISRSLLQFMSIELVMLSNHLILCHPLLLLPSIFPSIRVLSSELALLIRWPKCYAHALCTQDCAHTQKEKWLWCNRNNYCSLQKLTDNVQHMPRFTHIPSLRVYEKYPGNFV